jgi:predicted transcriptional regulator
LGFAIDAKLNEFKEFVLSNPELKYQEIADHWGMSDSAVESYLDKVNITRKKRVVAIKSVVKRKEKNGKSKSGK